jgi:hypothetical protein
MSEGGEGVSLSALNGCDRLLTACGREADAVYGCMKPCEHLVVSSKIRTVISC